jgi:flavin reductase (DIM6/NTAB) family NADH-FMN oxidoreductase RutF
MIKKEVPLNKTNRLINSGQLILVTSAHQDKRNIVTLAWHMPFSHQPPLVAIAVAKKHFSSDLIRQEKEFVVNVPDITLLEKIIYCGSHSGRDGDKFQATGLTTKSAERLKTVPHISECIGHIECRLQETLEKGDHYIFVGEPLYVCAREDLFSDIWEVDKVKLVFHLGGKFFTSSAETIRQ